MIGPVAYMDPGTGSLFLQLLLGGVAGAAVLLKVFWRRLLSVVGLAREEPAGSDAPLKQETASEESASKP